MKITALRGVAASILLLTAGCATGPTPSPVATTTAPAAPAPGARVLVTIVVDQLAAWIAAERWPELPADGGFARLRREGLYVRELRYAHATTDTAPGHSALYTGAVPRDSGIFGNDVIPEGASDGVSIIADPMSRVVVTGAGASTPTAPQPGVSLASLGVDTLADVLIGRDPQAAIYSFSLKDRGALFGAGRHPTLALWLDPAAEAFVSSTAFTTAIPDWVTPLGGRDAVRAACARGWKPFDQDWVARHALTPDPQPGEGDYAGLGRIFPHPISSAKALRATPEGDELLLGLARAAIARVAPAPHPTLLAISFSSNDYVGHMFGPDSWEAWDELRQLDHRLAQLLASLDSAVGPDAYAVMLSGDHGIGALPELTGAARQAACRRTAVTAADAAPDAAPAGATADCVPGRRLLAADVIAALESAWQRELEIAPGAHSDVHLIQGISDAFIYLSARGRQLDAAARARLTRAGAAALRDRFGIAQLVDVRAAAAPCPPLADESRAALVCRSLRPSGPADFYLVVEPRSFFDARYTPGAGVNHGSPYRYDRAVPLLVRAPGRVAAGGVRERPVMFTAFVRTAASLLGLPPPAGAGEGENLAPPAPATAPR